MSFNSGMKGADVVALLKNGLPIVDDVNKLDPNAVLGSMASVAVQGSVVETSVRNLYQPDESMIDPDAGILTAPELLSSVNSIKVFAPTDIDNIGFEPVSSSFFLVPRDFSMEDSSMASVAVIDGAVVGMIMIGGPDASQEFVLCEYYPDNNSLRVFDDQVEAFNAVLANGMDWCYFSNPANGFVITEEEFNTIDLFVNAVADRQTSADVYIKKDKWEQLYKSDLNRILQHQIDAVRSDLDSLSDFTYDVTTTKTDKIPIVSYSENNALLPNVYTTLSGYLTGTIILTLVESTDTTIYNEYILELKCTTTPAGLVFEYLGGTPATIVWANDTPPILEAGYTYLISIANNFGVFAQYINS